MGRQGTPTRLSPSAGIILGFFCAAIGLGGLVGLAFIANLAVTEWRISHRYLQTTCTVLDKRVSESRNKSRSIAETSPTVVPPRRGNASQRVYRPEFRIRYTVAGTTYDIWTYDGSNLYRGLNPMPILDRYEVGRPYPCWYDPNDPGRAVLVRQWHPFAYFWVILPAIMIAIGVIGILEVRKAVVGHSDEPLRRRRKDAPKRAEPAATAAGTRLPVRLPRVTPWSRQRRLALGLGLFLVGVSGGLAALMAPHWSQERLGDRIGMSVVLGAFGLTGLLLLYSAVHQALASFTAETIVEVEHQEVGQGATLRVRILQPGPVALRSLNATLVRKQTESLTEGRTTENYEFYDRFFEIQDVRVGRGEVLDREAELTIPRRAVLTGTVGRVETRWLIEVWGRVRGFPGFMHQYEIVVIPHRRAPKS